MKSVMDEDFLDLPDDFNLTAFSEHIFADMETEFRNNFKDMDDSHSLVLVTFYSIFTLCGLLANTLFCVVVLRCKKLHNVTHMLMTNLACCNIVFLIFYPAYLMNTFIFSYSDWQFGTFMCKVCLSVIYISSTGSFWLMSLVAVDRWAAIFVPKKRLDMLKCIILTLVIWVISFCVAGPYIYYSEVVVQKTTVKCGCTMEPSRVYFGFMSMTMLTIVFQYIIPLLIIVPAYAHIAHFLYSRQPVGEQSREKQLKHIRRKRRLLGTLMAIVALLIVSWVPIFFVRTRWPQWNRSKGELSYQTAATNIDTFIYSTIITLLGVTGIPICFLNNDLFRKQLFCLLSCIIPDRLRTAIHTDRTDVPHNATALLHATDVEMDGDSRMATSIRSSRRGTPVDIALMPNLGASVQLKEQSSPRAVPKIKIEEP